MAEKDLPYHTDCWKVIRGQADAEDLPQCFDRVHCCGTGGLEAKITPVFAKERGGVNFIDFELLLSIQLYNTFCTVFFPLISFTPLVIFCKEIPRK